MRETDRQTDREAERNMDREAEINSETKRERGGGGQKQGTRKADKQKWSAVHAGKTLL